MYFRFGSALVLVFVMSVAGIAIEKQCLALKRAVIRQQYRRDVLGDEYARLRLETQQLGAPVRLFEALDRSRLEPAVPSSSDEPTDKPPPLVAWRPARPADR
jgi:cell division protein FtsL